MSHSSWLKVSEPLRNVWRIENNGMVSEYLVTGSDKALLIDTGWGIGDLAEEVKNLTSLPVIVVNTHGHPDHTCGNYQFGDAHIHEADVALLKRNYSPAMRFNILKRFPKNTLPTGFSEEAWIHAPLRHFTPFKGPMSFDLGGRSIEVIETPGHTHGSICLYDKMDRILFCGDNFLAGNTMLHMEDSTALSVYYKSVTKLVSMVDKFDKLMPAHGKSPIGPGVLREMQAGLKKVLDGSLEGTPIKTPFGEGLSVSFGECGVTYREDRL
jgi:glyoxylase-like metal-dependent hydrolase (beta-lactamase superfamily II)